MSTFVTGPVPDQAFPRTTCFPPPSIVAPRRGAVMRARGRITVTRSGGLIGPLIHVVAGFELSDERLAEHLDALQPLDRGNAVPVRHDQP